MPSILSNAPAICIHLFIFKPKHLLLADLSTVQSSMEQESLNTWNTALKPLTHQVMSSVQKYLMVCTFFSLPVTLLALTLISNNFTALPIEHKPNTAVLS